MLVVFLWSWEYLGMSFQALLRSGTAKIAALVVGMTLLAGTTAWAAPTPAQREEILAISALISKAGNLFKAEKFKEAGEVVTEAQERLEKLAEDADAQMIGQLTAPYKKLTNAHALLELEGVKLPELKPLEAKAKPKDGDKPAAGSVSFVKQVAPIIISHCGGCHVRNARGDLSMATYESLMKGSKAGKIVFPKDSAGSVLIEKIVDKEMPPSGAGIPEDQLALLKAWVEQGAAFDGPNPAALLSELAQGAPRPGDNPAPMVVASTGKETISFSRDVAPILVEANCLNCHGAMRQQQNLNVLTFEGLLKGGDGGPAVLPGKGADSFLVKKLRGTAPGARMPQNGDPVADEKIAKIEKWIDEGATFDSPNPKQPLPEVAALAKANFASHEELSADRAKLAMSNWRLALPTVDADKVETANYLVLGNVGPNTLKEIGDTAEAIAPKLAEIFKAPADKPLVKGRMTLFVLKDRYDYTEFGNMVERRELPREWRGHFRYSGVDAYGVVVPPSGGADYSLETLVGQQLASGYVASIGKSGTPNWFAQGAGRVVASRLNASDSRVVSWDNNVIPVISSMQAPDDFLNGKLDAESTDVASYSFVKFLMADGKRFNALLDSLRKGGDFNASFSQIYGGSPNQATAQWVRKPPGKSKPAGKANTKSATKK